MAKIRAFEKQANQLYLSAKVPGLTHMCVDQEVVAVGVYESLRGEDYIARTLQVAKAQKHRYSMWLFHFQWWIEAIVGQFTGYSQTKWSGHMATGTHVNHIWVKS